MGCVLYSRHNPNNDSPWNNMYRMEWQSKGDRCVQLGSMQQQAWRISIGRESLVTTPRHIRRVGVPLALRTCKILDVPFVAAPPPPPPAVAPLRSHFGWNATTPSLRTSCQTHMYIKFLSWGPKGQNTASSRTSLFGELTQHNSSQDVHEFEKRLPPHFTCCSQG